MTDYIDISFLGDKELQRKLKQIEIKAERKIVRSAISKAMKQVKDRAKELAPVNLGRLKASIKQQSRTKRGISRAKVVTGTREELGVDDNQKGFYPAAIEYGYKTSSGKVIPAKPFMRRAITEKQDSVMKETRDRIAQGIEREAKR